MIKRVILDVDDVLNSLTLHILQHYGCDVGPHDYDAFPVDAGYDITTACEQLGGAIPYKQDKDGTFVPNIPMFWDSVTVADLWRSAPKSLQCDMILDRAADLVGRSEVYLATTPTKDPKSHADKLLWIWDNLPSWMHRQYFITPRKWCLAKPEVLLIDDHKDNCDMFESEGGVTFLLPRPWNPSHRLNTDKAMNFVFNTLMEHKNDRAVA
jgi:hypothetical protein